ncbi:MAG: hypothetical protein EOM14_14700, partial [Clostridia bacterium]|nr:hypothetical protein [Clostridia bacterium]
PDLIVLTGDNFKGKFCKTGIHLIDKELVKIAIHGYMSILENYDIPVAIVFGNHDYEAPLSVAKQAALYESYETCLGVSYGENEPECGAFTLPVYTSDGAQKALELYFFDSGSYLANGDYDTVSTEQVEWYNEQSAALHDENDGQALPSVAFFHIPLPEVYELFTETIKGTDGAFEGVGVGKGKYYLPNYDMIFTGDVNESPCPSSINNGLFNAFLENDDVFLAVNGHDHVNSYIGSLHGVDLANAPGSSYTSYGDKDIRGVRLFRFTEHCIENYETIHVRYSDYNTALSYGPLRYYFSTTTALPNALKILILLVVLVAVLVVLIILIVKKNKHHAPDAPTDTETDEPPEFDEPGAKSNDKQPNSDTTEN